MASNVQPFYAAEITVSRPGGGTLTITRGWNTRPWNALALNPAPIGASGTIYASDIGYRSLAGDPAGVVPYPPLLSRAFSIDRRMKLDPGQPAAAAAWGILSLFNQGGQLSAFAASWNVDGRPIRVLTGNKTWDDARGIFVDPSYASLVEAFVGVGATWSMDATNLLVPLRDATYWLERPLQTALYLGTGGYDGTADLTGKPKPKARGGTSSHPICNVTPTLIDPTNRIYQFNDAAGTVVALYEGGATTITFASDTTNLYSGSTPAGQYRTDNSRGLFQLGSAPAAGLAITADVTGEFPVAGAQTTIAAIAHYLLSEDLALPSANLDTGSFTAADAAYPYLAGVYWGSDDNPDGAAAISTVLSAIAAKLVPMRDGTLRIFVLRGVTGSAVARFDTTNLVSLTPNTTMLSATLSPPTFRVRVGYQHNYTVQTTGLSGSITDAQRQFIASPDRYAAFSSNDILSAIRRPNDLAPFGGALLVAADAQAVANDVGAFLCRRLRVYDAVLPNAVALAREFTDAVALVYPTDDLVNGQLGQIVGEQLDASSATTTFQVLI